LDLVLFVPYAEQCWSGFRNALRGALLLLALWLDQDRLTHPPSCSAHPLPGGRKWPLLAQVCLGQGKVAALTGTGKKTSHVQYYYSGIFVCIS
jgi:hypothetical protein